MKIAISLLAALAGATSLAAQDEATFTSPGLAPARIDAGGRLVEDWGALGFELRGQGLAARSSFELAALDLEDGVPAARASWRRGPVQMHLLAFRGPAWPAGIDVLRVRLEERAGEALHARLRLLLPAGVRLAGRVARLGRRAILTLPEGAQSRAAPRAWGHLDEAAALPGWAHPEPGCDAAFANIRAGMGGVPIHYRFALESGARADVLLGFCESYWSAPGSRFMTCKVEGAALQRIDPLARWGRHRPGAVLFEGRDENRDGQLEVLVVAGPGSPDRNPILNALWVFPPGLELDPGQVIAGRLNAMASFFVDVGGKRDQSLYPPAELELPIDLAPHGARELTLLVACRGAAAPLPGKSTWTASSLRAAARRVWAACRRRQ